MSQLSIGDLVAVPFGGTWRAYMTMKAADVLRLPPDFDPLQAAMLSVNPVTAAGLLEGLEPGGWILPERVAERTQRADIRRAFDAVAGDAPGKLLCCLGADGELICYGLLNSDAIILGAADVVFGTITVKGYSRLRVLRQMGAERVHMLMTELGDLLRIGVLQSPIERVYPLAEVTQAVEHANRPGRSGKIIRRMTRHLP